MISLAQGGDLPPRSEPGKCYAKYLIKPDSKSYEERYPVYFWADIEADFLKKITLKNPGSLTCLKLKLIWKIVNLNSPKTVNLR